MLTKRIIACLDVRDGRTVKGVQFESLRDMGDPVELAACYATEGADELVFLDISATQEKRKTFAELVKKIARAIDIPFTVGGGISSPGDVRLLLQNGADKVSINSGALSDPQLIKDISREFGSQCLVVAIDTKKEAGVDMVFSHGGARPTGRNTFDWVKQIENLGAGEILLTSIDHDGTRNGFATGLTKKISTMVNIPVIASGGAGTCQHFTEIFEDGKADAALAAGIFHERLITIPQLKTFLREHKIDVR